MKHGIGLTLRKMAPLFMGIALAGSGVVQVSQAQTAQAQTAGTRVVVLGTAGGPLPRKDRAQSSNLLAVGDALYLIDVGDGVTRRIVQAGYDFKHLDKVFITKTRAEWMKTLKEGGDFIYTIVNSINDLPSDQQVLANNYIVDYEHEAFGKTQLVGVPVILTKTPGNPRGRAPELGEQTETILTEILGYSWEEVAKMREAGAI